MPSEAMIRRAKALLITPEQLDLPPEIVGHLVAQFREHARDFEAMATTAEKRAELQKIIDGWNDRADFLERHVLRGEPLSEDRKEHGLF
jgi:hypothetical protein